LVSGKRVQLRISGDESEKTNRVLVVQKQIFMLFPGTVLELTYYVSDIIWMQAVQQMIVSLYTSYKSKGIIIYIIVKAYSILLYLFFKSIVY